MSFLCGALLRALTPSFSTLTPIERASPPEAFPLGMRLGKKDVKAIENCFFLPSRPFNIITHHRIASTIYRYCTLTKEMGFNKKIIQRHWLCWVLFLRTLFYLSGIISKRSQVILFLLECQKSIKINPITSFF